MMLSHTSVQHASEAMRWSVAAVWVVVLVAGAMLAVMPRGRNRRAAVAGLALLGAAGSLLSLSGGDPGLGLWAGGRPCMTTELLVSMLPLGVSFIAAANHDATVLRLGYAFEQATKQRRPPTFMPTLPLPPRG